jgi:glycine/D-amino acid oxidase-like deaminating enzyme
MGENAVLIVGAGPTGLTLACDLSSRGIAVTVIDKAACPATTSRALGLQPRGRERRGDYARRFDGCALGVAAIWWIGSGSARLRRGGAQQSRWSPSNSSSVMRQ